MPYTREEYELAEKSILFPLEEIADTVDEFERRQQTVSSSQND